MPPELAGPSAAAATSAGRGPYRLRSSRFVLEEAGAGADELAAWIDHDVQPVGALRSYLARRAILRGRGRYLWPPVDTDTLARDAQAADYARRAAATLRHSRADVLEVWRAKGWLRPHRILILWWPRAHVVTAHVVGSAPARIPGQHELVDETSHTTATPPRAHCTASSTTTPTPVAYRPLSSSPRDAHARCLGGTDQHQTHGEEPCNDHSPDVVRH